MRGRIDSDAPTTLSRPLSRLASESYDLFIVGGGVNGLATAWDAAQRGLRVALVDKGDFGAETSAASLKIIHGGLRYLQHLDLPRVREGVRERRALMRMAPHLIRPAPFLVPTSGLGMRSRMAMLAAMTLNDLLSLDRNRGQPHRDRRVPRGRLISARECLGIAPGLDAGGLSGGAVFCDGQMHNAERMNLLFALAAERGGADLANYVEATGFARRGGRIEAARCREENGGEFEVRASVVVNMAGPWTDQVAHLAAPERPAPGQRHSAGFQIITPTVTTRNMGLAVTSAHEDPDAVVKRGGRHYFSTPWRGHAIWGTTDTVYEGAPEDWRVPEAEVEGFVADINAALPGAKLDPAEIRYVYGGLRPVDEKNLHAGSKVARKHEIMDHATEGGPANLLSVRGVKYTACRLLAERAVDAVFAKLGRAGPGCRTAESLLPGAGYTNWGDLLALTPADLDPDIKEHLARTYGTESSRIAARLDGPGRERVAAGEPVTRAELDSAIGDPSARHLDDVLFRRTELCTAGDPGEAALDLAAEAMAAARGWDLSRREDELARVRARLREP